jgi:epoxyqueuosine reductase
MTSSNRIIQDFYKGLETKGYKGKVVHAKRIPDLRDDIKKRHEQKLIFPPLYEAYKAYFEFVPKVEFDEIKSLFIIAIPDPQYEAIFNWEKIKIRLIIPPTYLYGFDIVDKMKEYLESILNPKGYSASYAQLPQKTLAVRCGLAEYGRNNITYISGLGSFYRLATFYTDVPVEHDNWQDLKMMDLCQECSACIRKCPTGAIPQKSSDHFLLFVENCLTYHNEQPGDIPFPDWIEPSWHNCLVGCLHCQKICPANKKVKDWIKPGPNFSEQETKILLRTQKVDDLPDDLKYKLEKFDFLNYLEVFPRNLSVLLKE